MFLYSKVLRQTRKIVPGFYDSKQVRIGKRGTPMPQIKDIAKNYDWRVSNIEESMKSVVSKLERAKRSKEIRPVILEMSEIRTACIEPAISKPKDVSVLANLESLVWNEALKFLKSRKGRRSLSDFENGLAEGVAKACSSSSSNAVPMECEEDLNAIATMFDESFVADVPETSTVITFTFLLSFNKPKC